MERNPGDVTQLLLELRAGNRAVEEQLIPLVYAELRRIASAKLRHEIPNHSLEPTALVHEAYMRLTRLKQIDWQNRSHFFAVSATLMRRILVDHARTNLAQKRGDKAGAITLSGADFAAPARPPEILALDEALNRLALLDKRQSKVVELRFFGGLNEAETGEILQISERTVKRDWRAARAWLFAELHC